MTGHTEVQVFWEDDMKPRFNLGECTVRPSRGDNVLYVHHANTDHVDYFWTKGEGGFEAFIHPDNIGNWEALGGKLQLSGSNGQPIPVRALFYVFVQAMWDGAVETVHRLTSGVDAHWSGCVCSTEIEKVVRDRLNAGREFTWFALAVLPDIVAWESRNHGLSRHRAAKKACTENCPLGCFDSNEVPIQG